MMFDCRYFQYVPMKGVTKLNANDLRRGITDPAALAIADLFDGDHGRAVITLTEVAVAEVMKRAQLEASAAQRLGADDVAETWASAETVVTTLLQNMRREFNDCNADMVREVRTIYNFLIAKKAQRDRGHDLKEDPEQTAKRARQKFWAKFLKDSAKVAPIYTDLSAHDGRIMAGQSGLAGVTFCCSLLEYGVRAELYINREAIVENRMIFNHLVRDRDLIEQAFGQPLLWENLTSGTAARISISLDGLTYHNRHEWDRLINFMATSIAKLQQVFLPMLGDFDSIA